MKMCSIQAQLSYQIAARKVRSIFVHSGGRDDGTVLTATISEKSMLSVMVAINVPDAPSSFENSRERI